MTHLRPTSHIFILIAQVFLKQIGYSAIDTPSAFMARQRRVGEGYKTKTPIKRGVYSAAVWRGVMTSRAGSLIRALGTVAELILQFPRTSGASAIRCIPKVIFLPLYRFLIRT